MAEEISKPLCEANKVTMVSSGGGEVGAAKLSCEVLDIMTRLPETVEKLTGVSISQVTHPHGHIWSFLCPIIESWRMNWSLFLFPFLLQVNSIKEWRHRQADSLSHRPISCLDSHTHESANTNSLFPPVPSVCKPASFFWLCRHPAVIFKCCESGKTFLFLYHFGHCCFATVTDVENQNSFKNLVLRFDFGLTNLKNKQQL